jgi:hypothetical protein
LLILGFALTTTYAQDAEPLPDIAWTTSNGELWLAGADMEPVMVADDGACCAVFSQEGSRLAYIATALLSAPLMVLDLNDPTAPRLVRPDEEGEPIYFRWGDENTIFFNTVLPLSERGGMLSFDDLPLWRADMTSGEVTPFPANGIAYPNPRGDLVAVVDPGIYNETPMTMTFLRPDGEILSSHQHASVSSGSHLGWVAEPYWSDSGNSVRYAVPDPDLVYTVFGEAHPPTQLYEAFSQGDDPVLLGEIIMPFPAEVVWSPDGSQAAYVPPLNDASQQNIMVMTVPDGESVAVLDDVEIPVFVLRWRDALAISNPSEGVILWTPDSTVEIGDVLGVTAHPSGGWVLLKRDGTISLYLDGEEQIIASDIDAFGVTLAGH